jgi:hypothetical protein
MGGDRREDVAAMERPADGPAMVPPVGQHDPPRAREVKAEAEESVVRSDEVVPPRLDGDRPALSADSGIHDREMHRAGREEPPRAFQQKSAAPDVLRGHLLGLVHLCSAVFDG